MNPQENSAPQGNQPAIPVKMEGYDFFAIDPKKNCPHISKSQIDMLKYFLNQAYQEYNNTTTGDIFSTNGCQDCNETKENWVCQLCGQVYCSRYMHGHMLEHNSKTNHDLCLSFSDGSFMCYSCDEYIITPELEACRLVFGNIKHRQMPKGMTIDWNGDIRKQVQDHEKSLQQNKDDDFCTGGFTIKELGNGIKKGDFKRIVFLSGAGISVNAGIPDFRSKGGVYETLAKKYELANPEEMMTLQFFKENPKPFYELMKQFSQADIIPTLTHRFFKLLQDKNILHKILTQNVDALEIDAGVSNENIIMAHGHIKTASCSDYDCKKSYEMEMLKEYVNSDKILYCDCGNAVKPDVVLFGEKLPDEFKQVMDVMKSADLVIVMGTSLKVYPFNSLVNAIYSDVPVVLMNMEKSMDGGRFERFLYLEGDTDQQVKRICEYAELKLE